MKIFNTTGTNESLQIWKCNKCERTVYMCDGMAIMDFKECRHGRGDHWVMVQDYCSFWSRAYRKVRL